MLKQLELMLVSGELNPRHQHCVTLYHNGLICKADTLGSCGYISSQFIRGTTSSVITSPATASGNTITFLVSPQKENIMQTQSNPVRAAESCPSPVVVWQTLLTHLLDRHYGLTLSDTPFGNDGVIQEHIDAGFRSVMR